MTVEPSLIPVTPQPALPRTIGAFNLIFGGFLLLVGLGCLYQILPFLRENDPFQIDPVVAENVAEEFRKQTIGELRAREQSATTDAVKARLRAARLDMEAKPFRLAGEVDFRKINADLPWLSRYLWVDLVTGPVLNLLLVLSGVGLVFLKRWGHRLAVAVALLKVVRLLVLSGILAALVVPSVKSITGQFARTGFGKAFLLQMAELQSTEGSGFGGPTMRLSPREFVDVIGAVGYGSAVTLLAIGLVYPIVILVVLGRADARAACSGAVAPHDPFPPA